MADLQAHQHLIGVPPALGPGGIKAPRLYKIRNIQRKPPKKIGPPSTSSSPTVRYLGRDTLATSGQRIALHTLTVRLQVGSGARRLQVLLKTCSGVATAGYYVEWVSVLEWVRTHSHWCRLPHRSKGSQGSPVTTQGPFFLHPALLSGSKLCFPSPHTTIGTWGEGTGRGPEKAGKSLPRTAHDLDPQSVSWVFTPLGT